MFVWQHIDIDPAELENIRQLFYNNMPDSKHFWTEVPIGITEFLGLPVHKAVMIQMPPKSMGVLHVDDRPNGNCLALNFALEHCEESITEIWKPHGTDISTKVGFTTSNTPYTFYPKHRCLKVAEFKVTKPVIFRTDLPHCVNNFSKDKVRKGISIRFEQDPWHLVSVPPDQRF